MTSKHNASPSGLPVHVRAAVGWVDVIGPTTAAGLFGAGPTASRAMRTHACARAWWSASTTAHMRHICVEQHARGWPGLAWPGHRDAVLRKWVEQVREPVALAPLARFKQSAGRMAVVLCRCVLYVVLMNVALPSGAIENGRSASATARKPATAAAGLAASSARHRAAASERPERSVRRTATPDLPNAQPEARAGVPAPT